jgi:hypothetical protein
MAEDFKKKETKGEDGVFKYDQSYRDEISIKISLCQDRLEHLEEETWN